MRKAINNIDRNFHESFYARGFGYVNASGASTDSVTGVVDASKKTTGCPPGTAWMMGTCMKLSANPDTGAKPIPNSGPTKTTLPGPGGPPVPLPTPTLPPAYPSAGTLLGTYCAGADKMGRYADGAGGYTAAIFEKNSASCGYVAPAPTPVPTPIPVPVPTPTPGPAPIPLPPSDGGSMPVYPGGGAGGGGGYEEPVAEEINWPAIVIAGAVVGLTYWYMGKEKAAA